MEPLLIPPRPPPACCAVARNGAAEAKPRFFRRSLRLIPPPASVSVYILKVSARAEPTWRSDALARVGDFAERWTSRYVRAAFVLAVSALDERS
jgi:hypothetical protein